MKKLFFSLQPVRYILTLCIVLSILPSTALSIVKKVQINITVLNSQGIPQSGLKLTISGNETEYFSDEKGAFSFEYEYDSEKGQLATIHHRRPEDGVARTFSLYDETFNKTFYIDSPVDIQIYKRDNTFFALNGIIRSMTGEPLKNANISSRGSSRQVFSGEDGTFSLSANYNQAIVIRADGYENTVLPVARFLESMGTPYTIYLRPINVDKVYTVARNMPQFKGGMKAMQTYLNEHRKPLKASGVVVVQFIVEVDGKLTSPIVVRPLSPEADAEALRLVQQMPVWQPAEQGGVAVRCRYSIPITFPKQNQ